MDSFRSRFDDDSGFHIIGDGPIGGKAGGLAFVNGLLQKPGAPGGDFPEMEISIPETLVIASSGFDCFIGTNGLAHMGKKDMADEVVATEFLSGRMPSEMVRSLGAYLRSHTYPLAVRSSGMWEDTPNHAYAGLYRTYILSNDQRRLDDRLDNLINAIKLVYASTYYQGPKAYAKRVGHHRHTGQMAVIIQRLAGSAHGGYYYPAISGVAQSRNYYPQAGIRTDEGVATIAAGLGKQVVSGERALRFCPRYPKRLLQRGNVEELLTYAQRRFYALELNASRTLNADGRDHVARRQISDAADEYPIKMLVGTYVLDEHRIKDTVHVEGPRVLTFASVLKYGLFPLPALLIKLLSMGETTMNAPVEMEFAVDISAATEEKHRFHLLQMRPMTASKANVDVTIGSEEKKAVLSYTQNAMGNHDRQPISDIVYVKPDRFDPGKTRVIARQIAGINAHVDGLNRNYLLVGPGRWGSADPWLGIPVRWPDISCVAAIVETVSEKINAEPSTGAHFFHNLVSLGIGYLCVTRRQGDHFNWAWLLAQRITSETEYVAYVQLQRPVTLKVDGRTSTGVILLPQNLRGKRI